MLPNLLLTTSTFLYCYRILHIFTTAFTIFLCNSYVFKHVPPSVVTIGDHSTSNTIDVKLSLIEWILYHDHKTWFYFLLFEFQLKTMQLYVHFTDEETDS